VLASEDSKDAPVVASVSSDATAATASNVAAVLWGGMLLHLKDHFSPLPILVITDYTTCDGFAIYLEWVFNFVSNNSHAVLLNDVCLATLGVDRNTRVYSSRIMGPSQHNSRLHRPEQGPRGSQLSNSYDGSNQWCRARAKANQNTNANRNFTNYYHG